MPSPRDTVTHFTTEEAAIRTPASTSTDARSVREDIPYTNVTTVPAADYLLKHFPLNGNHNSGSHATPVKVMALQKLLEGYPNKKYIVEGFTHAFELNYQGNNKPLCSNNSASVLLIPQL